MDRGVWSLVAKRYHQNQLTDQTWTTDGCETRDGYRD